MEKMIVATRNEGKLSEIKELLSDLPFEILSLKDIGYEAIIDEDQNTFEGNAIKKAIEVMKGTGEITLADDSGLTVDALRGMPGVYSARFAGPDADDAKNNNKLLKLMENFPYNKRKASFRCVIAVAFPNGSLIKGEGECRGWIGFKPIGNNGFGYDPIFYPQGFDKTLAQLTKQEKSRISHRGAALRMIRGKLWDIYGI